MKNNEVILKTHIFKKVIKAELKKKKRLVLTGLLKQPDSKIGFPLY